MGKTIMIYKLIGRSDDHPASLSSYTGACAKIVYIKK